MERIAISSAATEDQEVVVRLLDRQMSEHGIEANREGVSEIVARVIADNRHGFFLLATVGGNPVGVAYVAVILSVEHGGRVGWLEELYVLPEHREQGIGTALLGAALERAGETGLLAIDLEVDAEHPRAESLYERSGFRHLPRARWMKGLSER